MPHRLIVLVNFGFTALSTLLRNGMKAHSSVAEHVEGGVGGWGGGGNGVGGIPVRAEWRNTALAADHLPPAADRKVDTFAGLILDALVALVAQSATADAQNRSLLRIAQSIKQLRPALELPTTIRAFLDSTVATVLIQAFFDTRDPHARTLVLSAIARLYEYQVKATSIQTNEEPTVPKILAAEFFNFAQSVLHPPNVLGDNEATQIESDRDAVEDENILQLCAVTNVILDWTFGRTVLADGLPMLYGSLSLALSSLSSTALSARSDNAHSTADPAVSLMLQSKNRSLQEVIKALINLLSKFPHSRAMFAERHEAGLRILHSTESIVFAPSPPAGAIFVPECQLTAAILLCWMLQLHGKPETWVGQYFSADPMPSTPDSLHSFVIRSELGLHSMQSHQVSDFSRVAFFRGILTAVNVDEVTLASVRDGNTVGTVLSTIYTFTTAVVDRTSHPNTRVAAFQTLVAWYDVLKSLVERSASSVAVGNAAALRAHVEALAAPEVLEKSFEYIFAFWEDTVDSIQHKLRDMFILLLDIVSSSSHLPSLSNKKFMERMVVTLLDADWHRKAKYDLLSHMLGIIEPEMVLSLRSKFHRCLLFYAEIVIFFSNSESASMKSRICFFIVKFYNVYFKPEARRNMDDALIRPVSRSLTSASVNVRRAVSEAVVGKLISGHPPLFEKLLSVLLEGSTKFMQDPQFRTHGLVAVLGAGRSMGLIAGDFALRGDGSEPPDSAVVRTLIVQAMCHPDANIRNDVCGLICESHKGSAEPTASELELVLAFIRLNATVQASEFRQKMVASVKRFLERVKRTMYANRRDIRSRKAFLKKTGTLEEGDRPLKELEETLDRKRTFLTRLANFWYGHFDGFARIFNAHPQAVSLHPGTSFPRASLSLDLMRTMRAVETLTVDSTFQSKEFDEQSPLNDAITTRSLLLTLLFDTYEPNRLASLALLSRQGDLSEDVERGQALLNQGISLLSRVRTNDAESGCFFIRLVFKTCVSVGCKRLRLGRDASVVAQCSLSPQADFLDQLLSFTELSVAAAEKSISKGSSKHPMHASFIALRYVIEEIDFKNLDSDELESWRVILERALSLSKRACDCVLPILSNDSPEGQVPDEDEDIEDGMSDGAENESDTTSASQVILRESFRTMKEACALIEIIVCRVLLGDHLLAKLFSRSAVIEQTGLAMCQRLLEVRHRGGFSGVYYSFCAICLKLSASKDARHVALLEEWLNGFVEQVSSFRTSVTRRSGGLPLGIVGILRCPFATRRATIKRVMATLMAVAQEEVSPSANVDIPQVHAFNVIRQLVLDADSACVMHEYIADAFILSVKGFGSPVFPIRNCATMLFAALTSRSLGVKKSRDEHDAVNSVTGREFFARYPELYHFLVQELDHALKSVNETIESGASPAFYPILTILSRLKPYSLESQRSLLTLNVFRPIVSQCRSAAIYQVREIAAKAFVSLLSVEDLATEVSGLIASLSPAMSQNELHGTLLQVQASMSQGVLRDSKKGPSPIVVRQFLAALLENFWILELPSSSFVNRKAYIELIVNAWAAADLSSVKDSPYSEFWRSCLRLLIEKGSSTKAVGESSFRGLLARFILDVLPFAESANHPPMEILLTLLNDEDYEVQVHVPRLVIRAPEYVRSLKNSDSLPVALVGKILQSGTDNAVVYESSKALVLLAPSAVFRVRVDGRNMSRKEFCEYLSSTLRSTKNTYLVEALLPLFATVSVKLSADLPEESGEIVTSFISVIQKWIEHSADYVRLAVIKSLEVALPQLAGTGAQNSVSVIDLLVQLDVLLTDDDAAIRDSAASVVGSLLGYKEAAIAEQLRWPLYAKIVASATTQKAAAILRSLMTGTSNPKAVLESEIRENDVLFSREDSNTFREDSVSVSIAFHLLKNFSLPFDTAAALLDWASSAVEAVLAAQRTEEVDMYFLSGRPKVFAMLLRAVAISRLLESKSFQSQQEQQHVSQGCRRVLEAVSGEAAVNEILKDLASTRVSAGGQWGLLSLAAGTPEK
ncbi:putative death-receptor fusion protein-domain-containing protein [Zopfochytrium polystomum]|nr:putative death-receptor fusion protein-domain-containing protein [Zopfochytrium polystomum]